MTPVGEQFDGDSRTWSTIGANQSLTAPTFPGVTAFANQIVAVVAGRDGAVNVWASPDGVTWTRQPVDAQSFEGDPLRQGSPRSFTVSGQNDSTIVIPISSNGVGDEGLLIVGHVVE